MEFVVVNKKAIRTNKAIKGSQKEAKKYFGRTRGTAPKAKINKFIPIKEKTFVSLTEEKEYSTNKNKQDTWTYEEVIAILRYNNLTGLSGNGFLVADKMEAFHNACTENRILLVNGVECDPGLIHDEWILEHKFNQIIQGIHVLEDVFQFQKRVIATKKEISGKDSFVEIKKVPNRYPMGAEKILIRNCFGITLESHEIPVKKGILVMNVQTVMAIGAIIMNGEKFSSRYLTVANLMSGDAVVIRAELGMDAREVLKKCMPQKAGETAYLGSGAMSCHELKEVERITATTNFIAYAQRPEYEAAGNCKNCGACSASCPMKIKVHKIIQDIERGKTTGFESYYPESCIQCGACTYVCHAGKDTRRLVKEIKISQ